MRILAHTRIKACYSHLVLCRARFCHWTSYPPLGFISLLRVHVLHKVLAIWSCVVFVCTDLYLAVQLVFSCVFWFQKSVLCELMMMFVHICMYVLCRTRCARFAPYAVAEGV